MKVDGIKFVWHYDRAIRFVKGEHINLKRTTCLIFRGSPENVETLIASGSVTCSTEDVYDHEKGRRLALRSALLRVWRSPSTEIGIHTLRHFRTRVWEVYRTLTKEPRWTLKKVKNAKADNS